MKKAILLFTIFLFAISLFAQEPMVKFYMNDGSTKVYQIEEIENFGIIKSNDTYYLSFFFDDSNKTKQQLKLRTIEIDSLRFNTHELSVFTPYCPLIFKLFALDSIVIEQKKPTIIEYNDNTKLLDTVKSFVKIDSSNGKIVIEFKENSPDYKIGDIIISQKGKGFLGKIKSITKDGNNLIVDTTIATISEAFKTLYLDTVITANPDDIIKLSIVTNDGNPIPMLRAIDTTFTIEEDGKAYYVHIKYGIPTIKKGDDKIQGKNYPIHFEFPDYSITINNFSFEADLITVGKNIALDFEIQKEWWEITPNYLRLAKIEEEGFAFQNARVRGDPIEIKTPPLLMIQVPLSPPPLVITTGIEVELGFSLSAFVETGISSEFEFNLTHKIGMEYQNGSVSPIAMINGTLDMKNFDRNAIGLEAKYFGEVNAGIYLYGLIGPSFFIQPYINGIIEIIQPNKNKNIYFNFGSGFGARFGSEILNISFIEISRDFVFSTWDYYQSPEILDINPKSANIGDIVTITGNYFAKQSAKNYVSFNGIKAAFYELWKDDEIKVKVPNGASTGYVNVHDEWMASNSIDFTVSGSSNQPQINSIAPTSAKIGDVVTISGTGFGTTQGASIVSFNNIKATGVTSWKETEIKVKVPAGATSGKVSVTVNGTKSNEIDFTIKPSNPGDYESITIGTQVWMKKNLDVDHYRNGDPIPQVTDPTEWANLKTGAWCYYNNDPANGIIYGKLYNWYAVNDPRGLALTGWHVPSDDEWKTLEIYLDMSKAQADDIGTCRGTIEGGKLKEQGTTLWNIPNTGASNITEFSAIPGGYQFHYGKFYNIGLNSSFWTTTEDNKGGAYCRVLYYNNACIYRGWDLKAAGYSVRCVKDNNSNIPQINNITPNSAKISDLVIISGANFGTTQGTSFVTFNGIKATEYTSWKETEIKVKVPAGAKSGKISVTINGTKSNEIDFTIQPSDPGDFESITIGTQVWMKKNLDVDHYCNGDPIPQVNDPTEWCNLNTGAWCYYNNDPALGELYGKLYNWYAINDSRGLSPNGWHVPSNEEWTILTNYLGGESIAGGKLREAGTIHWLSPNKGATNESGFSALPGGWRDINYGKYGGVGDSGIWWSSTQKDVSLAWDRHLYNGGAVIYSFYGILGYGYSVRCVKD